MTKLKILNAFLERIKKQGLHDISVGKLCERAFISEGTFFNYFPKKSDVMRYFIAVWSLEVGYFACREEKKRGSLAAIETVFSRTAELLRDNEAAMFEVIVFLARERKRLVIKDFSTAEKVIAFPDYEGIADLEPANFLGLVEPYLRRAVKNGELPANTDIKFSAIALKSIFFGTVLALTQPGIKELGKHYDRQLEMLWDRLKARV